MTTCMFLYVITRQYLVTVMNKKEDHENKEKKDRKGDENKIMFGGSCLYILFDNDKKNIKKNYFTFNMYYW